MGKKLVLAEKPSVGRDIARVLGCSNKKKGYMEGNGYVVTYAMGHLVQLATPESYDKKYETWSLETLPMIPERFKLEVMGKTSHQYKIVKQLLHRKDVSEVIIATDAGREGELVARWILDYAGNKKPIKRLWISSVTDQAIRNGFKTLKDGNAYKNLYYSAVARAQADWIVGLNASRALTCKFNDSLSCGRVQTPTLSMVNTREEEIKHFVPKKLYGIKLTTKDCDYNWVDNKGQSVRKGDKSEVEEVKKTLSKASIKIVKARKQEKKKYAPSLYDLTTLQQDAASKYDFSAKETVRIMQSLYETHKVLSYPRTDSKYLTADIVGTLPERLRSIQIGPYKSFVTEVLRRPIKGQKHFVDDSKVSDHHAIIPTEEVVDLAALSSKEYKIYDLVVKRFLGVLMKPSIYMSETVEGTCQGHHFINKSEHLIEAGYEVLYDNTKIGEDRQLPKEGAVVEATTIRLTEIETKPPSRFTEGSLIGAMENPSSFLIHGDGSKSATLKQTGGLGTVATRADIIEKLYNHQYMEKKGKYLYMTNRGRQLLKLVPNTLRTPDLTAEWEMQLSRIEKGKVSKEAFITQLVDYTKGIIKDIKVSDATYRHHNLSSEKCPDCGKNMLIKENKYGKSIVCSDRACGYKKKVSISTNARCPNCHKKLNLVGEGDGQRFVCKCGYKEKMSSFKKRRGEGSKQMNKGAVGKYLKEQKGASENFNNPFKDLLNKLDN